MIYNSYQIAHIIGVNVSTVKRWTDSGKLKCHQSVGGHRKFYLHHLTDFLKDNKETSININITELIGENSTLSSAIDNKDYSFLIKYSYEKLISSDANKFIALSNSLILKGYKEYTIFDDILNPTLIKIGDQWVKGKLTIAEEHLASEIIRKFLSNLNFEYLSKKNKYNAFCFTLTNDKHDMPLNMSESIFNQHGKIKTFNLGPNLPIDDFLKLSEKVTPHIIFISIIYIEDLDLLKQQLNLLCKSFENNKETIILLKGRTKEFKLNYTNFINIENYKHLDSYILEKIK